MPEQFDVVDFLMRYDAGDLSESEFITLFQYLIDTGMAWHLQGRIGRTAQDLIESGVCQRPAANTDDDPDQGEPGGDNSESWYEYKNAQEGGRAK